MFRLLEPVYPNYQRLLLSLLTYITLYADHFDTRSGRTLILPQFAHS
jgi:hypothetical protein